MAAARLTQAAPRGVATALQSHLVALGSQVETFIFSELINQPIHQALVSIVAAKMRVPFVAATSISA